MYPIFQPILGLLKIDTVVVDNNVFRLHYKATMFILIAFSLLLTQKQYFGDPIDCKFSTFDRAVVPGDANLLDTYCWIQSTYTLPDVKHGPYAGVGSKHSADKPHERRHHTYYQWVTLFLYFQALLFYLPRYLWKVWEGGKLKMLVSGLQMPICDETEKNNKKEMLVTYFKNNLHDNNVYAIKYVICEVLNLINVVSQIFITNLFVGNEFSDYGVKILQPSDTPLYERHDKLAYVFPKVTMCEFEFYGPSGTLQKIGGLCVLPLNIFNEKIYIILWFWFVIIAVITGLGLLYRFATFFQPVRSILLRARAKVNHPDDVAIVNEECNFGDWFLLSQIGKNMELIYFKECLHELAIDFKMK